MIRWTVAWTALRTFLRNPNGNPCAVYSNWNDGVKLNYNWLDNNRNADNPSVLLATRFISLPFSRGSFVY